MNPADPMQTLAAPGLRLEPLLAGHADELYAVLCEPDMFRWIDQPPPASLQALRERFRLLQARMPPDGSEAWLNWALRPLMAEQACIGKTQAEQADCIGQTQGKQAACVGLVQATVMPETSSKPAWAWIAYQLSAAWRGRGLARAATAAMIEHLRQDWGCVRCLACVEAENLASIRLLQALGFVAASADEAAEHSLSASERLFVLQDAAPQLSDRCPVPASGPAR